MTYKVTKQGYTLANGLTLDEAKAQLEKSVVDYAVSTWGAYDIDDNNTVTDADSKRVVFESGDESASFGGLEIEVES